MVDIHAASADDMRVSVATAGDTSRSHRERAAALAWLRGFLKCTRRRRAENWNGGCGTSANDAMSCASVAVRCLLEPSASFAMSRCALQLLRVAHPAQQGLLPAFAAGLDDLIRSDNARLRQESFATLSGLTRRGVHLPPAILPALWSGLSDEASCVRLAAAMLVRCASHHCQQRPPQAHLVAVRLSAES
jgi:hypothetical protein